MHECRLQGKQGPSAFSLLLDQAECPVSNPPPMAMIINIPERVLLIKVTKRANLRGETAGYTLVFYDVTALPVARASVPRLTRRADEAMQARPRISALRCADELKRRAASPSAGC
jgi:hypothetical protein